MYTIDKKFLFFEAWRTYAPDMPEPLAEYPLVEQETGRRFKADFAFPEHKISVEVDGGGFKFGGGRHSTDQDRDKGNLAAVFGWRVFHFSPQEIKRNPRGCVALVKAALAGGVLAREDVPKPRVKKKAKAVKQG